MSQRHLILLFLVANAFGSAGMNQIAMAHESEQAFPDGLSASDWSSIRAAFEAKQNAAIAVDGGWEAVSSGQQWIARFDGRGFEVEPSRRGEWKWGLALERWGREGAEVEVTAPIGKQAQGQRVAYAWDTALTEWWLNDSRGLEHGFTVTERPPGDTALVLTLGVRGDLTPVAADEGRAVRFTTAGGAAVVNYTSLTVFDAGGRELPARFDTLVGRVRVIVNDSRAQYPLTIDPLAQQAYLKPSVTGVDDQFGYSVGVFGDTVVVGAPTPPDDTSSGKAGAAYVFLRSGSTWSQQAVLTASNPDIDDEFGRSVAISGDTVVVGAMREDSNATFVNGNQGNNTALEAGAAYVFVRSGSTWSQQAYLKAHNTAALQLFGISVAISGDTVVVGANQESTNATGVNGIPTSSGYQGSGAAYVFVRNGTVWSPQAYLKEPIVEKDDQFGWSVSVSGDTVVVGAPREDSSATGVNGNLNDDSAPQAGAAYVFARSGATWSQQAYLKASNTGAGDQFGYSVSVDGDSLVVGAPLEDSSAVGVNGQQTDNSAQNAGAAYVFVRSGSTWIQQAYLKASNTGIGDSFGASVAVSGDGLVVGAPDEDSSATSVNGNQNDGSALSAGAAYVFARMGPLWAQQAYLKASNAGKIDSFAFSIAASGDTIVVGAPYETSSATGVNGNQGDNSMFSAGAAYVFDVCTSSAAATPYGAGKPGAAGVPVLASIHPPKFNTTADLTLSGGLAGASPVFLMAGFAPLSLGFDGGTLLVTPTFVNTIPPLDGSGSLVLPVPITVWACGLHFYFQAMFVDPGAAGYYHTAQTNGLDWTIGG